MNVVSWKEIYALNLKMGLRKVIEGIDYFRVAEYSLVCSQLGLEKDELVLDVGSLDSTFPVFLASLGHHVYATDVDRKVLKLEGYASKLGISSNLRAEIQDAVNLSYANSFFRKITAVSTLEHVLPVRDGDTRAIKEIARVLQPGGRAVITIPYGKKFDSVWRRNRMSGHTSLMRRYDKVSIHERIVKPSSLRVTEKVYFGESVGCAKIWYNSPLCWLGVVSPFLAHFSLKSTQSPETAQGVCLCLQK